MLYCLSAFMNLSQTLSFWFFVAKRGPHEIITHNLPFVVVIANNFNTNCVLSQTLSFPVLIFGWIYILIKFLKSNDHEYNPYIHWNSISCFAVAGSLLLVLVLLYVIACNFDQRLKNKSLMVRPGKHVKQYRKYD